MDIILYVTLKPYSFIILVELSFICSFFSETKNQWARDDPAFVVIFSLFLIVATSAYCVA